MTRICSVVPLIAALLIGLFPLNSHALQGETPYVHVPGARAERSTHPAAQARLERQAPWQDFLSAHGPNWRAVWDEATQTPFRFWGEGWEVQAGILEDDDALWAWSENLLAAHLDLLGPGIAPQDLERSALDRRAGITTVAFTQRFEGLPVVGSRISLRFKAGRFVMGQLESLPGIRLSPHPAISEAYALERALSSLAWKAERTEVPSAAGLVVFPILTDSTVDYRLAWQVELRALDFPSRRSVFVDASDGSFLGWHEHIRFAAGTVLAEIDDRYPLAGTTEAPMPGVEIVSPEGAIDADGLGEFSLAAGAPVELSWSVGSAHWDIDSQTNSGEAEFSAQLQSDGGTVLAVPSGNLSSSETRRVRAQLDIHVSGHTARDYALGINPSFPWAFQQADANVNIPTNNQMPGCNAWFDEQSHVNFLRQGAGCNNTGRIADVMYHEYGHGFHIWSIIPGAGDFDGALSEGLADYMSGTITGTAAMAPNFFLDSTQPLRDIGPDHVWPEDIAGDPHYTGLIIAGALWDLRGLLVDDLGESAGVSQTDHIFWQIASRASGIDSSYPEALLADDDNGNLADGTPNQCLIDEAFAIHGLHPGSEGDLAYFFLDHEPLETQITPFEDLVVDVDAGLANPECAEGELGEVRLYYSTDVGAELSQFEPASIVEHAPGAWEATIPGIEAGTLLRYHLEATDLDGEVVARLPSGSITDPWYATWVGPREILFESDFEADDGGFTHELLDGPEQEGADDWGWGPAGGLSGDPTEAASGETLWGNDITPAENWNGAYQPNVHNVLHSPSINVGTAPGVHLQFRRWLTVEDGFWDHAWVEVNGTSIWTQHASPSQENSSDHHQDFHWAFRSYDVTDLVDADGFVQISWHLETDGGLELGGWNIDDVALIRPGEATPPTGDDDDAADDDDDASGDDPPESDEPGGSMFATGQGCACSSSTSSGGLPAAGFLLALFAVLGLRRRR